MYNIHKQKHQSQHKKLTQTDKKYDPTATRWCWD